MTEIHINLPETATNCVIIHNCPDCKTDRFFHVDSQLYYEATHTCLTCLRQFQGGYRLLNPFKRGWKKERMEDILYRINLGEFDRVSELIDKERC